MLNYVVLLYYMLRHIKKSPTGCTFTAFVATKLVYRRDNKKAVVAMCASMCTFIFLLTVLLQFKCLALLFPIYVFCLFVDLCSNR